MHRRPKVKSMKANPKPTTASKPKSNKADLAGVPGTSFPSTNEPTTTTLTGNSQDTANDDNLLRQQFEIELCWCIQTLENSLNSVAGGRLSEKQAVDIEKTLKILKSAKQPMIKKRQIMRATFGDYRTKMAEEEKKHQIGKRQIRFTPKTTKKARFIRKSTGNSTQAQNNANHGDSSSSVLPEIQKLNLETNPNATTNQNLKFVPSDNSFRFNFSFGTDQAT